MPLKSPSVNQLAPICFQRRQWKNINPHRQRLLAAEVRAVKPLPKPDGKAKAKPKAKAKDDPKTKKPKKSQDSGNEPRPTRSEYSEAKQNFILKNLCLQKTYLNQTCFWMFALHVSWSQSPPTILFLSMAGAKDEGRAWWSWTKMDEHDVKPWETAYQNTKDSLALQFPWYFNYNSSWGGRTRMSKRRRYIWDVSEVAGSSSTPFTCTADLYWSESEHIYLYKYKYMIYR